MKSRAAILSSFPLSRRWPSYLHSTKRKRALLLQLPPLPGKVFLVRALKRARPPLFERSMRATDRRSMTRLPELALPASARQQNPCWAAWVFQHIEWFDWICRISRQARHLQAPRRTLWHCREERDNRRRAGRRVQRSRSDRAARGASAAPSPTPRLPGIAGRSPAASLRWRVQASYKCHRARVDAGTPSRKRRRTAIVFARQEIECSVYADFKYVCILDACLYRRKYGNRSEPDGEPISE